jgi:uncharacterized protein (TIGR02147 family)
MSSLSYHARVLKEVYDYKKSKNASFSLRAYAKYLGVNSPTLSHVLNGKRALSIDEGVIALEKLNLSNTEKDRFLASLVKEKSKLDSISMRPLSDFEQSQGLIDSIKIMNEDEMETIDNSYYKVIAEWEHFGVLELFELSDVDINLDFIASKLDLTVTRTLTVMDNLKNCGLIEENDSGKFVRKFPHIKTSEDVSSRALMDSHQETLKIASEKLESVPLKLRDYSSVTIPVDLTCLNEFKTVIREFRRKLSTLSSQGNKSEVYQLAIQFFPLSKVENRSDLH